MFKSIFILALSSFIYLVKSQDCILEVPNDPLKTGLFKPWYVSTSPCSQTIAESAVFVEATILDTDTGNIYVYNPLVIDKGTKPAIDPIITELPVNNVVIINIGANSDSVKLVSDSSGFGICYSSPSSSHKNSLACGHCVNGIPNSIFGQVAYCNAINFFNKLNELKTRGIIVIPPIGVTVLGDPCPTVRSFVVVDQDQSDNVLTEYILTSDMKVAQDYPDNRNILNVTKIIKNGSDNRLLSNFIAKAIGCETFSAPDIFLPSIRKYSMTLNEIQAGLLDVNDPTVALTPSIDPMCLVDGVQSLEKTNAYRLGLNQPILKALNQQDNINYCNSLVNIAVPFFIKYQTQFSNFNSPDINIGDNLLNFLCNRLIGSWDQLNCKNITGNDVLLTVGLNDKGVAISNNLNSLTGDMVQPCCQPITEQPRNVTLQNSNFCGMNNIYLNCSQPCPNGLDGECVTPGYICFNNPDFCTLPVTLDPNNNFCGDNFNNLACTEPCIGGLDSECITPGFRCFNSPGFCIQNTFSNSDNFCGKNFDNVYCNKPCPNSLDSECSGKLKCFNKPGFCKRRLQSSVNHFCGSDINIYCDEPCPSGLDKDCSYNSTCFAVTDTCFIDDTIDDTTNKDIDLGNVVNFNHKLRFSVLIFVFLYLFSMYYFF